MYSNKKTIHTQEYRELINSLVTARKNAGLTQGDVAFKLGYTQSFISKIENSQVRIDPILLKRFAEIYEIDLMDLLNSIKSGGINDRRID